MDCQVLLLPPATQVDSHVRSTTLLPIAELFWDFRNRAVQDYWAEQVCLAGVNSPFVDGVFTDDPTGYGAEHPVVQSAVQLSPTEIAMLQAGTQRAWSKALALLTDAGKYVAQAFRLPPPFNASIQANGPACTAWMRTQCAVPANESALTFLGPGTIIDASANMSLAAFLVARGPYSFIQAPRDVIEGQDWENPIFRLYRLDTGVPTGPCEEVQPGIFSRGWSHGTASVDCTTAVARVDFGLLRGSHA